MLSRFKTALYNVVGSFDPGESNVGALGPGVTSTLPTASGVSRSASQSSSSREKGLRFPYTRPHFLQLNSEDEIQVSADHAIRPIICPRDINRLPWKTGYAETINAGKSKKNEDQAMVHTGLLTRPMRSESSNSRSSPTLSKEQSLSVRNEPFVNGHAEEVEPSKVGAAQEHTVVLSPQGATTETSTNNTKDKKENSNDGKGSQDTNNSNTSGEESRSTNTIRQGVVLQHPLAEPPTPPAPAITSQPDSKTSSIPPSTTPQPPSVSSVSLPYFIFGVFDGHAGWGAAVAAANQLHHIIHEKLCDVIDVLLPDPNEDKNTKSQSPLWLPDKEITVENVVTGALECAFWEMDNVIGEDRLKFQLQGGCTACVALFIHGKLFLANAGDSRAVISRADQPLPMSHDFTPETDNQRIRKLGAMHPELLGGEYTHLDFFQRPLRRDLGRRILYRDHYMSGWTYKTITPDDLKYPLVCGEGKRSRVLATIGVTRGFGDHDLKAQCSSLPIKPFLTPEPEVRIFDLTTADLTDGDVLILATDGLWDITTNEKAVSIVTKSLSHFPAEDHDKYKYRYTGAAQDLVMSARGKLKERNWRTSDDKHATIDDISVFVVPLKPYKEINEEWTLKYKASGGASQKTCEIKNRVGATSSVLSRPVVSILNPVEPTEGLDQCSVAQSDEPVIPESNVAEQNDKSASPSEEIIVTPPVSAADLKPQEDYFRDDSVTEAQTTVPSDSTNAS
ncbi:Protein phosphatase 1H [Penaeus vannamei]|uniref:Protein phosphatase 1H n=1 Tax=Penaeus vannamei TaxID=6689 RepID=A0A3R7NMA2_PENVA|nr:protein phosphatase 1H-like [Penaeus vannamei]XP_027234620.1 protein phosphatase 1H-like [Penaeus vannamei]XP_027234621.1 protein phosphatase 1H-like [Penaeus vannamei]XP_027234622.1 protein phosphatase 1H-like [Penaeus vannamei]XP_027234623.1 protein phosphatase 1H-like [Penaeus vannamei]ROT61913.1 Protein phosphatase 1H [Penaeus vannamei]